VESQSGVHHAVHGAALHLPQKRFKQFLHLDPGELHRGQFFARQQQRLHGGDPCAVQMHPIMMPAALPRSGAVALRGAAVQQQRLPGAEHHMAFPLLDEPCTPEGIKQDVTFLICPGGGKMLLGVKHSRLGAVVGLCQLCFAGGSAFPDAFRGHIHVVGQHFLFPHFLCSV